MKDIKNGIKLFSAYYYPPVLIAVVLFCTAMCIHEELTSQGSELNIIMFYSILILTLLSGICAQIKGCDIKSPVYSTSVYSRAGSIYAPVIVNEIINLSASALLLVIEIFARKNSFTESIQDTAALSILLSAYMISNTAFIYRKSSSFYFLVFSYVMSDHIFKWLTGISVPIAAAAALICIPVSFISSLKLSEYLYKNISVVRVGEVKTKEKSKEKDCTDKCDKLKFTDKIEMFSVNSFSPFKVHVLLPVISTVLLSAAILISDDHIFKFIRTTTMTMVYFFSICSISRLALLPSELNKSSLTASQKMIMTFPYRKENTLKFLLTVTAENIILIFGTPITLTLLNPLLNGQINSEIWHPYIILFAHSSLYVPFRHFGKYDTVWGGLLLTELIISVFAIPISSIASESFIQIILAVGVALYLCDIAYQVYSQIKFSKKILN